MNMSYAVSKPPRAIVKPPPPQEPMSLQPLEIDDSEREQEAMHLRGGSAHKVCILTYDVTGHLLIHLNAQSIRTVCGIVTLGLSEVIYFCCCAGCSCRRCCLCGK